MDYQRKKLDDATIEYALNGELKHYTIRDFRNALNEDVESGEAEHFIFDFSNLEYIDSQGISCVVLAGKYNHKRGKKLIVKGANDNIKRIFALAEIKFIELSD